MNERPGQRSLSTFWRRLTVNLVPSTNRESGPNRPLQQSDPIEVGRAAEVAVKHRPPSLVRIAAPEHVVGKGSFRRVDQ